MLRKARYLLHPSLSLSALLLTSLLSSYVSAETVVGSTPAEFTVSGGDASYSIPIQVAPGRGGMQPDLSLNYSGGGNGVLGVGWSLGGLSSIHRCPANIEQDGFTAGVSFSSQDRYCLDGTRLIPVIGVNGAVGTEYKTEIDGYSQIISMGGTVNNPSYFIAKTKAGQVITFGGGSGNGGNASMSFPHTGTSAWSIREVNDSTGNNPVTYLYSIDQNVQYLDEINYGNGRVHITYGSGRRDTPIAYYNGHQILLDKVATNIDVYAQNNLLKTYQFIYENPGLDGNTRLVSAKVCDAQNKCVTPTTFDWTPDQVISYALSGGRIDTRTFGTSYDKSSGDFNNDGIEDLLWSYSSGSGLYSYVSLGNGNGTYNTAVGGRLHTGIFSESYRKLTGDFNGDGKLDLAWSYTSASGIYFYTATGLGNGFFNAVTGGRINTGTFNTSYVPVLSDYNNDGMTDIMWSYTSGSGIYAYTALSNGDGTFQFLLGGRVHTGTFNNAYQKQSGDFNGDGVIDLAWSYISTSGVYFYTAMGLGNGLFDVITGGRIDTRTFNTSYRLISADFNNDGVSDVSWAYPSASGLYHFIALGKGNGTFAATTGGRIHTGAFNSGYQRLLGDFNGDGNMDLAWSYSSASGLYSYRAMGNGDGSFDAITGGRTAGSYNGYVPITGDVNADGITDHIWSYSSGSGLYSYSLHNTAARSPSDLISQITDASGSTIELNYQLMTDASVYTKGTTAQYPVIDLQYPQQVISSVTTNNGIGGTNTINYTYEGLKTHVRGRGSYGYAKITESYPETGKTQETYLNQTGFPLVGNVDRVVETLLDSNGNGQVINESDKTFAVSQSSAGIYTVNLDQSIDKSYELDGSLITTVTTTHDNIDAYGNIGKVTVTTAANGESFSKITDSTYTNDTNNWYLGRLTEATATHVAPGQANQQRRSQFTYDTTTGLLGSQAVVSVATGLPLNTTNTLYDIYGHKTQVTVSATGETDRVTTSAFNTDGRPTQTCNALNQCETYTYTPEGWLATTTGPNGITTTWEYDGFGRKTKEIRVDGTETTIAHHFAVPASGSAQCGLLATHAYSCTISQSTGSQPATVQYDRLGRELRKIATGFDGRLVYSDTEYNHLAQVSRVSRNYFMGDQLYWANSEYDALNRVTSMDEPAPHGTRNIIATSYNGLNTIVTSGPEQRQKTTQTNAIGQVVHRGEEEGSYVEYTYTADGNLATTTVAGNSDSVITLSYDEFGRKIGMDDPDMGVWSYSYNAFGQLISQTDAKQQVTSMNYDILGRMISRTDDATGTAKVSSWVYGDANDPTNPAPQGSIGKLLSQTDGDITQTFFYDSLGRPEEATTDIVTTASGAQSFSTQTLYDSLGRVSRTIYPGTDNFYTENLYNANGFLENVRGLRSNSEAYDLSLLTPLVGDAVSLAADYHAQALALQATGQAYTAKIAEYQALIAAGTASGQLDSSLQTSLSSHQTVLNDDIANADFDDNVSRIYGTTVGDTLQGTAANDEIYSGGASTGVEYITGNGGADRIIYRPGDGIVPNNASDAHGHVRVFDFIIDNTATNPQADSLALGELIPNASSLTASTITDYVHVVSGLPWVANRAAIFINVDGDFTAADRLALSADPGAVGNGTDLYIEFLGHAANNDVSVLTGHADNTVAQFQALIDMGFLDLSRPSIVNQEWGNTYYGHLNNTLIELQTVNDLINTQVHTYQTLVDQLIVLAEQTLAAADNSFQYERTLSRGGVAYTELQNDSQYTNYWKALDVDASGRISAEVYGNGIVNDYTYNQATGQLQHIHSSLLVVDPLRHLEYQYDAYQNVTSREDHANDIRETYEYDRLDRLTRTDISSSTYLSNEFNGSQTQSYDALGNITDKSDVGAYTYGAGSAGLHAVTSTNDGVGNISTYQYDANGNMTSGNGRTVTWSSFNKPTLITKDSKSAAFAYGPDRARYQKINHQGDTTLYVGKLYERLSKNAGTATESTDEKHYIYANGQLVAEHIVSTTAGVQTRYLHKDALGSVDLITDAFANVVDRRSFDAWGKLRNLTWKDLTGTTDPLYLTQLPFTNKGFTGHENIQEVGLIHMNGRIYDATLARFMSADPHIQEGALTQSYNRYSYVMNNPLKYTDPSGYFFKKLFRAVRKVVKKGLLAPLKLAKKALKAIAKVPVLNAIANIAACTFGGPLGCAAFAAASTYAVTGSLSAAFTAGALSFLTAQASGYIKGLNLARPFAALAHGAVGGTTSVIRGGKFGQGFASSFFTKMVSGGIKGFSRGIAGGANAVSKIIGAASAAIVGGTASVLGGGKFSNGAQTAAIQYLFNEVGKQKPSPFKVIRKELPRWFSDVIDGLRSDVPGNVTVFANVNANLTPGSGGAAETGYFYNFGDNQSSQYTGFSNTSGLDVDASIGAGVNWGGQFLGHQDTVNYDLGIISLDIHYKPNTAITVGFEIGVGPIPVPSYSFGTESSFGHK